MAKISILKEFRDFLKTRKRYWLAPIIIILLLLSLLIVFAQSSAVAPFILYVVLILGRHEKDICNFFDIPLRVRHVRASGVIRGGRG